VGDSIGVGFGPTLGQQLALHDIGFTSQAHVGWTVRQALHQLQASQDTAHVAVISAGSNDAALTDPTVEQPDIAQLLALLRQRGAKRVLWVVPPNFGIAQPPPPATKTKQELFYDLMTSAGAEPYAPGEDVVTLIGGDRIHLPPIGYQKLGQGVAEDLLR
jgi:lysophospholipase L1-like esterase